MTVTVSVLTTGAVMSMSADWPAALIVSVPPDVPEVAPGILLVVAVPVAQPSVPVRRSKTPVVPPPSTLPVPPAVNAKR